ncbi:hypothetical protein PC129_g1937 [Phytophthora cactorum]|uniref:Uncharacterized protein n=1 Tax=Phytophthora cactorum TaxID=29920 RepID=A0A8T1LDW7_9STRA|nr:hypothetical protein Pcac1_g20533 [Phytophthora cactorum]KAG3032629.1 hypothetical protein PC120_g2370 [Phytophthora cactorum]KAG3187263.1 hypothetical protein C6341_g3345 [Phytophthora cactorum]KAG3201508.1 hypothetical protein PC128_g3842 [Phytophthora cactorum]KAG3227504.1 hypothetical protein PC129_g1937 [Phytophthora cactorum]
MKSRRATNTGHCAAESPEDLSLYDLLCRAPLCRIERKNGRCAKISSEREEKKCCR